MPTWDGWGKRTADDNRALRQALFEQGQDDGHLLYLEDEPVGWPQVGPRDRLAMLVAEFRLLPQSRVWASTCFLQVPRARGRGWARRRLLMEEIRRDLASRGAEVLEAFPRRGQGLEAGAVWTAPELLFLEVGVELVQEHERRPRYRRRLGTDA